MSARLTLRQQTVPGPVFPGHRIAPGINKGSDAPLAYFCPSTSRGCSAGSVLRNTAAPPPLAHPCTLHPATVTFTFLAQAQAANAAVHWYKWKQKRLCTKNTQPLQQPCRLYLCKQKFARVVQPTCFPASALPLCFQRFEATAALLPSLCSFPALSLAMVVPVSVILSPFWHVTKDGVLKKDVCVFPISLISSSLLPVPLTLLSQHSAHYQHTGGAKAFSPLRRRRRRKSRRRRGLFAGEELELALMLASGLWSTQLRGIRSTVHLSAELQWNNIPCPTNLHLYPSPLFHRTLFDYKWKDDYALFKKSNPVKTPFNVWTWISTVKLVSVRNKLMLSSKLLA